MSYPSCSHGNADPNHECSQCATECVISDLTAECRTLRAERDAALAQLAAARADLQTWRAIIQVARDAWIKHATDNSPLSVFAAVLMGIDAAIDSARDSATK